MALIDKNMAIDICNSAIDLWHGQLGEGALVAVKEGLEGLPSVESERKNGRWIDDGTELGCCCSECGVTLDDYFYGALYEVRLDKIPNFCPNCGSYNGGEQDG